MAADRKDLVRVLALSALVMVVLPFGLRLALDRFDADDRNGVTVVDKLSDLFGDGRTPRQRLSDLAVKPQSDWTPDEISAQPGLHDWLKRHAKTVLPWEWSAAAKEKDRAGYCAVWSALFDEIAKIHAREDRASAREQTRIEEELAEREALVARLTARLQTARRDLETNGVPTTVVSETVRRGVLWGYNRKETKRRVTTGKELEAAIAAEEVSLREQVDETFRLKAAVERLGPRRRALAVLADHLSAARLQVEAWKTNLVVEIPAVPDLQMDALLEGLAVLPAAGRK